MNSNENDAMERNDVLSEVNILICYMRESELRMQSYGVMNMCTWTENIWDLDEFDLGFSYLDLAHGNRGGGSTVDGRSSRSPANRTPAVYSARAAASGSVQIWKP